MAFVEERVRQIERAYAYLLQDVLVLRLTEETLKLVLVLNDGMTLRVVERWQARKLVRYSYYWLDAAGNLKIGWDNYPHHKHVGGQEIRLPSDETCLEDVMAILEKEKSD